MLEFPADARDRRHRARRGRLLPSNHPPRWRAGDRFFHSRRRGQRASRDDPLSKVICAAGHHRAACAACSTWRPIRCPFRPISRTDPALAPLVATRPGLRVPGAWDGFELAIRAVLGQHITVSAAVRLAGRLVAAHGEPMKEPDRDLSHVFPRRKCWRSQTSHRSACPEAGAARFPRFADAVVADPEPVLRKP